MGFDVDFEGGTHVDTLADRALDVFGESRFVWYEALVVCASHVAR